jgi:outer membrane protein insertion porin family
LGGDFLWVNNLELRAPVYKKLSCALFLDAGNAWDRVEEARIDDLRYGAGLGLRYVTDWGVARADFGVRLSHERDEPGTHLTLTFGIPF